MPVAQGPAAPRRRLGTELRRLREASGLHLDDVARELGCSASKVSRLENGKGIPKILDVREMLRLYGPLDDAARERLLALARDGRRQTWWQDFADVITRGASEFDRFVALEDDASAFRSFELGVIHGLVQTQDYSRALFAVLQRGLAEHEIDRLVEVRARRQEVLRRAPVPLRLTLVLDEAALRRIVGDREVMRGQLEFLLEIGRLANVRIQVLTFESGALMGLLGSFTLIEFDEDDERDVVYLESRVDTYLEGPNQVKEYAAAFDELSRLSLGVEASAEFIKAMLSDYGS